MDTSVSLLEEARTRRSEDAWQRMVEIYDPLFRGWLNSLGVSSQDCDDLVQEILVVILRKLPKFEFTGQPGSFRAWAKRVALNCVREAWRSKKRVPRAMGGSNFVEQLDRLVDPASQVSRDWDRQHDRIVVQRLMDHIRVKADPQVWQAFSLHAIQGMPVAAVAESLGVTPNYVYVAKSRIVSRLRELAKGLVDELSLEVDGEGSERHSDGSDN